MGIKISDKFLTVNGKRCGGKALPLTTTGPANNRPNHSQRGMTMHIQTTIMMMEMDANGRRSIMEIVQPLPHNAGMWARRMRGLAKHYAFTNPDNTYHLTDGNGREFFRASI